MPPFLIALSRDYIRRLAPFFVGAISAVVLLPWFYFWIVLKTPSDAFDSRQFYPAFCAITFLLLCTGSMAALDGVRRRLDTMPISNRVTSIWLMAAPTATVSVGVLLATFLVNLLFGAQWPWLRPAIYFSVGVILLQAFYWRLLIGRPRQILLFAGIVGLLLWLMGFIYFPNGSQQPITLNSSFTIFELAIAAGVLITASWFGYRALGSARSGGGLEGSTLRDLTQQLEQNPTWMQSEKLNTTLKDAKLDSSSDALTWYFWREQSTLLYGGLMAIVLLMSIQLLAYINGESGLKTFIPLVFICSCAMGFMMGMLVGSNVRKPGDKHAQTISAFLSTKPVTTQMIWQANGFCLAKCSLVTWLCVIIGFALIPCFEFFAVGREQWLAEIYRDSPGGFLTYAISALLSLVLIWATASCSAALVFLGRDRLLQRCLIGGMACLFVFLFYAVPAMPASFRIGDRIESLFFIAVVAASLAFVVMFGAAMRRRLVSGRVLTVAVSVLCTLIVLLVALQQLRVIFPDTTALLMVVLVLLASASGIAAAPLALAMNRHR